jgi:hypothetical protein
MYLHHASLWSIPVKHPINFRLEENVLTTIALLAKDLHTSKTDIIEQAVLQFAASRVDRRNTLLQFAGTLTGDEADTILNTIKADKSNKDVDLLL